MKKKLSLFIAALCMMSAVWSQGIFEANLHTVNSIVRVWHEHESEREVIIYNEETPGQGGFLLYTVGSATAQHIDLPAGISVKDFEIMGDEVWFCGVKDITLPTGGPAGVVGTFTIPPAFGGSGAVTYRSLDATMGDSYYGVYVTGLSRLDLFQYGSMVVMAMVGDAYIYDEPAKTRSTVVSAYFTPGTPSSCFACALLEKDSTVVFTDIAAMDNVVTAVGTDINGKNLKAKTFHQNYDFPSMPVIYASIDSIVFYEPVGKALITHLDGDEVAVSQFDEKAYTMVHMLDFTTGTAVATNQTRYTCSPPVLYSVPWDMRELRYSLATDNISVLEYGMRPGGSIFETLQWTFPRTAWPAYVPVQSMNVVTQASMDVNIDGRPVTVGEVNISVRLDIQSYTPFSGPQQPIGNGVGQEPLLQPDNCTDYEEVDYYSEPPTVIQLPFSEGTAVKDYMLEIYNPVVTKIKFAPICE
jgi:hypothetical protein